MDYGINIAPGADAWKLVKRAEELGFQYAWFYDTQLLNADVFVVMAAAAMVTSKIKLGTGVLIPSNRIAPVTASALASLNKLAPGRIHCGVGTGFTARRTMGVGAMRLADVKEYIQVVRGLLARETVSLEFEGARRRVRFLNPDLELINTTDPIDFSLSAFGVQGRKLAAELGVNWIIPVRDNAGAIEQLRDMQRAWREAGRAPDDLYSTAHAAGCILAEGEPYDSSRAKAQAGPVPAMVLHDMLEAEESVGSLGIKVPPMLEAALEAYRPIYQSYEPVDARYLSVHRGHLMILRPEEAPLITGELIRAMSFTGTAPQLRDRVRELSEAGYRQFSPHIRYGQPQMLEEWAELLAKV
jgi:5,10-methylenetetrahydromethanopterin reductase